MMSYDFDILVTPEMKQRSRLSGQEWELQHADAAAIIQQAAAHQVAVLGVEVFKSRPDGLECIDYSGYEFDHKESWEQFVTRNNEAAAKFVRTRPTESNFCYILTAVSEREFKQLRDANV